MERTVQFLRIVRNVVSTCRDSCNAHILNIAELSSRILSNDKPMAAVTSIVQTL